MTQADRFWAKVVKTDGCWLWTAACDPNTHYGRFYFRGRVWLAHRAAYEMLVGPIPAGMTIDHSCHARRCVNPAHLRPMTRAENSSRGAVLSTGGAVTGARRRARTHCANGHEFTAATEYWYRGARQCKVCRCTHQKNFMARKASA